MRQIAEKISYSRNKCYGKPVVVSGYPHGGKQYDWYVAATQYKVNPSDRIMLSLYREYDKQDRQGKIQNLKIPLNGIKAGQIKI